MKMYIKEPFATLSHLVGALLSIVGLVILGQKTENNSLAAIASLTFGVCLTLLYVASTLTHGAKCSVRLAAHFERCDHAAIYCVIAGTSTPIGLLVVKGTMGWLLFGAEWILAFAGIYSVFFIPRVSNQLRVVTCLIMGWLFLFTIGPIISAVPNDLLAWLLGGVLFYSLGSIIFLSNRPTLWKGYFEAHDLWHVFVLGGSTCHFIFIDSYLSIQGLR